MRNMIHLVLFVLLTTTSCKNSTEFDPGPFARDNEENKTLINFSVTNSAGEPIENAYVVSYRSLAPKYIRVGEGFTNNQGEIQLEDKTHTSIGYATIVAQGYNSKKVSLNLVQNQDNEIPVSLENQDVVKVMSYNIEEGFKNTAQWRQEFANWVKTYDPDIILLQEMMHFTDASFSAFAQTYGHNHAVLTKTIGIPTGITSKTPITDIRKVVQTGILHHGYVTGVSNGIRLFSIHLCPFEVDNERNIHNIDRKNEIDIILNDAAQYSNVPIIIGGDLNAHNTFDRDTYGSGYRYGNRDHGVYNALKNSSFHDTYPLRNSEFKSTMPVADIAANGPNEGARIDYIFVNDNIKNSVVFSDIIQTIGTDKFSDHYPTYIEIKK